jgi:hypothetical protein
VLLGWTLAQARSHQLRNNDAATTVRLICRGVSRQPATTRQAALRGSGQMSVLVHSCPSDTRCPR